MNIMYICGALAAALYGLNVPSLSCLFFILYSTSSASYLAMKFFSERSHSFSWGFLLFLGTFSSIGTLFYYVFAWNIYTITATIILTPLVALCSPVSRQEQSEVPLLDEVVAVISSASPFHWIFSATVLSFIYYTATFATTASVRTPFELLPAKFFVILCVLTTIFFLYLFSRLRNVKPYVAGLLLVTFPLLLGSLLVPLGFGFDPFIHITTQEHIVEHGEILPKTPYYLGAYIFPTTISILSHSLHFLGGIDKFIAPLLFSLVAFLIARTYTSSPKSAVFSLLFLFLLPVSAFTTTTPHALAVCFGLLALAGSIKQSPFVTTLVFAITACLMHPLVGIGALILSLIIYLAHHRHYIIAGILLPALIIYPALLLSCVTTCSIPASLSVPSLPYFTSFVVSFDTLLDALYGILAATPFVVLTIILCATFIKRTTEDTRVYYFFGFGLLSLLLSSFLVQEISLRDVVSYENGIFATRMITIALIFGFPFYVQGTDVIFSYVAAQKFLLKVSFAILFGLLFTASVFSLYPRHNNVEISRFYSISQNDFDVVNHIAKDAGTTPYIVLAPQPTSSAALRTFGFTHYQKTTEGTEQFFYPIPTGGTLYSYYLKLVNSELNHDAVMQAAHYMNSNRVYVVIPAYWFDSARLFTELTATADSVFTVGTTMVGVYQK